MLLSKVALQMDVYCCLFRYQPGPETFGHTLVYTVPSYINGTCIA
jgi:hypothetical protein